MRPLPLRSVMAALFVCGAAGAGATPALAGTVTQNQAVSGATVATLGLTLGAPTTALAGLSPGSTATGTGALTIVDTGNWTLAVDDESTASTAGHPTAAASGCANSEADLRNPLTVSATGAAGTVTPAGAVSLTGAAQTLATGTSSAAVTTSYSDSIASSEQLITGCVYGLTAVYTLQG